MLEERLLIKARAALTHIVLPRPAILLYGYSFFLAKQYSLIVIITHSDLNDF